MTPEGSPSQLSDVQTPHSRSQHATEPSMLDTSISLHRPRLRRHSWQSSSSASSLWSKESDEEVEADAEADDLATSQSSSSRIARRNLLGTVKATRTRKKSSLGLDSSVDSDARHRLALDLASWVRYRASYHHVARLICCVGQLWHRLASSVAFCAGFPFLSERVAPSRFDGSADSLVYQRYSRRSRHDHRYHQHADEDAQERLHPFTYQPSYTPCSARRIPFSTWHSACILTFTSPRH